MMRLAKSRAAVSAKLLPLKTTMDPLKHLYEPYVIVQNSKRTWDVCTDSKYEILYIYTYTLPKKIS